MLFRSLDALVLRINGRTLDRLQGQLERCKRIGRPAADVDQLFQAYLGFLDENPNLWTLLFEHRLSANIPLPDWYQEKIDRVLGLLETVLRPAFPGHQLREARDSAVVLWASFHGICSLASGGKLSIVSGQSASEMARRLTTLFLAGIPASQLALEGARNA